jgi:dTDP-4-amino-4,6-dideoxygalactose transaminase
VENILQMRRVLAARYDERLDGLPITRPVIARGCKYNHAYYPVLFASEAVLGAVVQALNQYHVYPRRYFYPSLSRLSYVSAAGGTPVADEIASRVLCLPIYHTLTIEEIDMICRLIHRALKY